MSRVCIITQSHPSLNPRLVKEADALAEAGHEVAVIAPDYSEWARMADEEFRNSDWKIVERPTFGPLAPRRVRLAELARRFIAGLAVRYLRISFAAAVRSALHPATPSLVSAAKRHPADLYIAHYPAALPAAAIAAELHGAIYAYDAEDFHPGDLPDIPEHEFETELVRTIERRYLPGCTYVTASSPLIAEAYRSEYSVGLPVTVLNVFPNSRTPEGPTPCGSALGPSIYWFSQTIGPDRGLECAVKAIGLAKTRPHIYLRGEPATGYVEQLKALATRVGVTDQLHILARAAPSEMEKLAAAYDLGLVAETGKTRNHRIALSNKQFTYLQCGLPVVMSDIPSHVAFAVGHESCVRIYQTENEASLAKVLDDVFASPEGLAIARRHAFELGKRKFNWDLEKLRLVAVVEKAMQSRA